MTDDEMYMRVSGLLASAPPVENLSGTHFGEIHRFIAQAYAIAEARKYPIEGGILHVASTNVTNGQLADAYWSTISVLQRFLAIAELGASSSVSGSFISAGKPFDALAAVGKVLQEAKHSIRIVDPYMDEKALVNFAVLLPEAVSIELLADSSYLKPSLQPAVAAWKLQYPGTRLLEARKSKPKLLHDRAIFVDATTVWLLSQSLNAFAKRSPGTIQKFDVDTSALKAAVYEAIWQDSSPI